jgi:pimeloyl-ACP methyl ester carboxylesterase
MAKAAAAAKTGDARRAAIQLFDAVNQPITFEKVSPVRQQRWLDNANTMPLLFTGTPAAPTSCEQLGAIKVPVMVVGGSISRDHFRYGTQALAKCLPPGTESVQIPNAPHIWPAGNPEAAAKAILDFIAKH